MLFTLSLRGLAQLTIWVLWAMIKTHRANGAVYTDHAVFSFALTFKNGQAQTAITNAMLQF